LNVPDEIMVWHASSRRNRADDWLNDGSDFFSGNPANKWTNSERLRTINEGLATHNFRKTIEMSKDGGRRAFRPLGKIATFDRFRLTGTIKLATDG